MSDLEPKIWEAARATSAAPLIFSPIQVGQYTEWFLDGGPGHNNPIEDLYEEVGLKWTAEQRQNISCIVSIGTGRATLKSFGTSLKSIAQTLVKMATDTDKTFDQFAKNHSDLGFDTPNARLFRFQIDQGLENVGLFEHEKYSDIAAATRRYMEDWGQKGRSQLLVFAQRYGAASEQT